MTRGRAEEDRRDISERRHRERGHIGGGNAAARPPVSEFTPALQAFPPDNPYPINITVSFIRDLYIAVNRSDRVSATRAFSTPRKRFGDFGASAKI